MTKYFKDFWRIKYARCFASPEEFDEFTDRDQQNEATIWKGHDEENHMRDAQVLSEYPNFLMVQRTSKGNINEVNKGNDVKWSLMKNRKRIQRQQITQNKAAATGFNDKSRYGIVIWLIFMRKLPRSYFPAYLF